MLDISGQKTKFDKILTRLNCVLNRRQDQRPKTNHKDSESEQGELRDQNYRPTANDPAQGTT